MRTHLGHSIEDVRAVEEVAAPRPKTQGKKSRLLKGFGEKDNTIPGIRVQCSN